MRFSTKIDAAPHSDVFFPDLMSSLFLGFIFPSIFIIAKEEYACIQKKWQYTPFVILGIAIVAALTYMNSKVQVVDVDLTHFSVPTALYLFLAGAVAITAMFLPGISGSTVLLIFGVYLPVISGVKELLHLHFGVLPMIIVFGVGVICGALVSVKGIQKSLEKYRGQMVMLILGMLIGSLYAIVSGPVTVDKIPGSSVYDDLHAGVPAAEQPVHLPVRSQSGYHPVRHPHGALPPVLAV